MFEFVKIDIMKVFESVLNFIQKHGHTTILSLIILFLIGYSMYTNDRFVRQSAEQFEYFKERDARSQEVIYEKMYELLMKYDADKQNEHEKLYTRRMEYSPQINAELRQYLPKINTDHIVVAEYHNGYTSISTSIPFCKYSITYESHDLHHSSVQSMFQSVNISPLLYTADLNTVTSYRTNEIDKLDEFLYTYFKVLGIERIYYKTLTFEGKACGFVVCANYDSEKICDIDEIIHLSKELENFLVKIKN